MKLAIVGNGDIRRITDILESMRIPIISEDDVPAFVITYGGDGTILSAERKYPGIPKITLRKSENGSKCLFSDTELKYVLTKIRIGEYKIREELKLETESKWKRYISLNEVQIHNPSPINTIRFSVYIDDLLIFDNIEGDGVVIATPFGSTAYYSSIGGERFNKGIGIALNNQYKTKNRPIVIGDSSKITIKMIGRDGLLLSDNDEMIVKVRDGDEIVVRATKDTAKFVIA